MQIHQLKPNFPAKKKKRVGRGGKKGTYSGKGLKGQKARAGRKMVPIIREIIKKYHKLRGYRRKKIKDLTVIVNLETLEEKMEKGEIVSPTTLLENGIIEKIKGKIPRVKILGKGKLTKNLIFEDCQISKGAKEIIEKAGGVIKNK